MATESSATKTQRKALDADKSESSEDEYDEGDYNFDDEYGDELEDLELKDLDANSLAMLSSIINHGGTSGNTSDDALDAKDKEGDSRALVPAGGQITQPEEDDIDSEEEKDILKEIRDEVEEKVREELKDEIQDYHRRVRELEYGPLPGKTDDEKYDFLEAEDEIDPKLREAIIKMNKLDRILKKKIKKEREVKRERLLLEKRMREEVAEMNQGVTLYREIKVNTEKFFALDPPPSHNEGISLEDGEEDEALPPLFQTQIDDSEIKRRKNTSQSAANVNDDDNQDQTEDRAASATSSHAESSRGSTRSGPGGKRRNSKKDFIKRNKELAANANQPVAMTDDEKKRLNELLEGVDEMPELEGADGLDDFMLDSNPFQLALHPGEGFCPDNLELKSLTNIDERLRSIMPEDDYNSIILPSAASYRATPQQPLFTRVGMPSRTGELPERFGERVLYETKEERELKARLQAIEQELDKFKAPHDEEDESATDYHLTDEQLDSLLDQCARNFSLKSCPETPDMSARSQVSSRQSLLENPPRLTDEQLQQLLSEAHFPLSSTLLALREDDEKILEEEGSTEMIRAETWKAIKDANPDGEDEVEPLPLSTVADGNNGIPTSNISSNNSSALREANIQGLSDDISEKGSEKGMTSLVSAAFFSETSASHSAQEGSLTASLPDTHGGLPKISQSSIMRRSDSYTESLKGAGTPVMSSRESSDSNIDPLRLPDISANSFLIHAPQGMNNAEGKDRNNLPSRQPLQMVRNDLSDMRLNSFSEEDRDGRRSQGQGRRSSNGATPTHLQPRPPAPKDRPQKT